MGWVELHHTRCNLPNADSIKKVNAQPGSVWKCGDTGCSKTYVLESNWNFLAIVNIEARYVQTGDELIAVDGLEPDEERFAGLSSDEREALLQKDRQEKAISDRRRAERQAQLVMQQSRNIPPPPKPGVFERIFGAKVGE